MTSYTLENVCANGHAYACRFGECANASLGGVACVCQPAWGNSVLFGEPPRRAAPQAMG